MAFNDNLLEGLSGAVDDLEGQMKTMFKDIGSAAEKTAKFNKAVLASGIMSGILSNSEACLALSDEGDEDLTTDQQMDKLVDISVGLADKILKKVGL